MASSLRVQRLTGDALWAAYVWPHEILAAMAAKVAGRPVKLVLTRADMYAVVGYQPRMVQDVRLGADADGRLTAIVHEADNITAVTDDYVEFGSSPAKSLYAAPAITLGQRVRRGHVNLPTFMRSPIDGPGTWALGSAMDELAHILGVDPLDLRLANYADIDPADGQAVVLEEAQGGLRGGRTAVRVAGTPARRPPGRVLADRLRHGGLHPGPVPVPVAGPGAAVRRCHRLGRGRLRRHRRGLHHDLSADRREHPRTGADGRSVSSGSPQGGGHDHHREPHQHRKRRSVTCQR